MAMSDDEKISKLNIVYLEDMPEIRKQMVDDLRSLGVQGTILELDTVAKSLEFLKVKKKVDLFISDWNLPDGAGIQFLEAAKAHPFYKNVPFLMCTTMNEISNILQAVEKGASDYIVKPWDKKELRSKIVTSLK